VPINYVGHVERWDEIVIDGDITAKDCLLKYKRKGRLLAVASIFRDFASLQAEVKMEREATWRAGVTLSILRPTTYLRANPVPQRPAGSSAQGNRESEFNCERKYRWRGTPLSRSKAARASPPAFR
jgi:hypothetical protein